MKAAKSITLVATLLFGASALTVRAQSSASKLMSSDALVSDLYKADKQKRSPFFQTRSRALLYKYFEKSLADMIWKDAVTSKGEVGAIDGDPLYDAQDMDIKNFMIRKPRYEDGRALVDVTFENFGKKHTITFIVVNGRAGWRIRDIVYSEGRTLSSELKENNTNPEGSKNFEGTYQVGDTTCTVKPIKMAFAVKWAKGTGTEIFFYDNTASEQSGGKKIFGTEDKGKGKDQFIFDNDRYQSGKFIRADGKEIKVRKID